MEVRAVGRDSLFDWKVRRIVCAQMCDIYTSRGPITTTTTHPYLLTHLPTTKPHHRRQRQQQDLHTTYAKQEGQLPTSVLTALTEFGRAPRVVRLHAPPVYGALDAKPAEEGEGEGGEGTDGVPRGSKRLAGLRYVVFYAGGWLLLGFCCRADVM